MKIHQLTYQVDGLRILFGESKGKIALSARRIPDESDHLTIHGDHISARDVPIQLVLPAEVAQDLKLGDKLLVTVQHRKGEYRNDE